MKMQMTKKRMIYTLAVSLIVVFSTTFAILMTLERMDYRNYLQGEYSKNMHELINSVENIEDNLAKSAIVGTREQRMMIFEEIFRHSTRADDKIHSLPISVETAGETSKFLTQVGDYCYSLVRASTEGKDLTDEDYAKLDLLRNQSYSLKEQLNATLVDINEGRVKWGEIRKKASGVLAKTNENLVSGKFQTIEKQVTQYPALIYDGPFSDNVLDIKPKVNDLSEVSQAQAEDVVKNTLGKDKVDSIKLRTSGGQTRIDSYSFDVTMKGRKSGEGVVCEVSKRGGKIVYLLDSRATSKPTMDAQSAIQQGTKYLSDMGYSNMTPTYNLTYEDNIVVNYVYNQNNIVIYPDQIKLKIALDDGSIIGIESEKYLVSHADNRQITPVKVTEDVARQKVGKKLNVTNVRIALIPTETNTEVLCYEYSGTYNDDSFLYYVNAQTGEPQRILKIVNTPNGQMTI